MTEFRLVLLSLGPGLLSLGPGLLSLGPGYLNLGPVLLNLGPVLRPPTCLTTSPCPEPRFSHNQVQNG